VSDVRWHAADLQSFSYQSYKELPNLVDGYQCSQLLIALACSYQVKMCFLMSSSAMGIKTKKFA
jgi:hypothetical protein